MTDAKTTATDLLANLGHEAGDTDASQPKRDPNLTEVEPDDGFDEEYEFVAPATRPMQPSTDPDAGNEDLADETDWDGPTELPDADRDTGKSEEAPNESGDDEGGIAADEPDAQADMALAVAPASLSAPTTRAAGTAQGGSSIVFAREQVRVADVSL